MTVQLRLFDLLADKIKREQRSISVSEVARKCGVTRQAADKWFKNQVKCPPSFEALGSLCRYFECEPGDLFARKGAEVAQ